MTMTNIQEEKKVGDEEKQQQIESHAHHTGILRSILERAVANRFSSKPIDVEKNQLTHQAGQQHHHLQDQDQLSSSISGAPHQLQQEISIIATVEEDPEAFNSIRDVASYESPSARRNRPRNQQHYPTLTPSEQKYLEDLLESEDPDSIRHATLILSDLSLFPPEEILEDLNEDEATTLAIRDSNVQRLFFRMHEMGRAPAQRNTKATGPYTSSPIRENSAGLNTSRRRLGWNARKERSAVTVLESQSSMSSFLEENWRNSIVLQNGSSGIGGGNRTGQMGTSNTVGDNDNEDNILAGEDDDFPQVTVDRSASSTTSQDISCWLDGIANHGKCAAGQAHQQGVEVDDFNGVMANKIVDTAESLFKTSFAILGTAADDASCHPHVLSPPLMESLLEFVPETLSDYHFWIKYSLVRDGASLFTLLRHVRASTRSILAIETTDGQVFGAFTSQPWRLVLNLTPTQAAGEEEVSKSSPKNVDDCFYGSRDTFLWKMRQSRFESQALVRSATVEQAILMESELAVYPYTGGNNFVQHCSAGDGIGLGDNALAIRVDPSLRTGSTAASETFGNPCLLDPKEEAFRTFQIANLEVWTLTPHDTVKEAEQTELKAFFQQRQREEHKNRLDLFGILVGGPKRK
jgi:TLD